MNEVQQPQPNGSQANKLVYFPRADGSRIPYKVYSSQELYDLEQERIFRGPVWSFVALEAEIPNPGDFKSTFVGDTPWWSRAMTTAVSRLGSTVALIGARWSAALRTATREATSALTINGATTLAAI